MKSRNLIDVNPEILGGTAVINGTRFPVSQFYDLLREGWDIKEISNTYPSLTVEKLKDLLASQKAYLSA